MKILVVDDEPAYATMLFRFLQRLGHEPLVAYDADDALALLDDSVAGVITDIEMPGMSGIELAREIRDRLGPVPIAFCTGSDPDHADVRAAAELGPVLPKAVSLEVARSVVARFA